MMIQPPTPLRRPRLTAFTSRIILLALLAPAVPLVADTAQANNALQHGRVDEAERALRTSLAANPADPYTHQLLCRVFYAQDQADRAIPECEAAVADAPNDSDSQMWLARAYGAKAQHASPLAAFALARKVRASFERAVQTNPSNVAAMSDLGEFYVAAPAIVGGGVDKARRLATTLETRSPAKAHRLLGYLATSANDLKTAEAEFKFALAAGSSSDAFVDLAQFYQHQNQPDLAVAVLKSGIESDRLHGTELPDAASVLIALHREPDLAERAIRVYLASPAQSDGAPVFKVHLQLGRLLAREGDAPGARREYAAALALAPNFAPARAAVQGG